MYEILGTFLGTFLGIPAGLFLNHLWNWRVDSTRKRNLCRAIIAAIEKNERMVQAIEDSIRTLDSCPMFNVDLRLLDSTASLTYELLDDIELCGEIDNLRFALSRLERKVDLIVDLDFDPSSRSILFEHGKSFYTLFRPTLVSSIQEQISLIRLLFPKIKDRLRPSKIP